MNEDKLKELIDMEDLKEYANCITLNRQQITKLYGIIKHFGEIEHFTIQVNHSSGIGTDVVVKFDLFNKNDTRIDITGVPVPASAYEEWLQREW
jgi:hypothetical protein